MKRIIKTLIVFGALIIALGLLSGCGQGKKGNVSEIIKHYQKYVGKEVELSGYTSSATGTEWSYCMWDKPNKGGEEICVMEFGIRSGLDNVWRKSKVIIRQEGPLIYAEVIKPLELGD